MSQPKVFGWLFICGVSSTVGCASKALSAGVKVGSVRFVVGVGFLICSFCVVHKAI